MKVKPENMPPEDSLRKLDEVAAAERRRRFRETTMAERIETAFELGDLARELRAGMLKASP